MTNEIQPTMTHKRFSMAKRAIVFKVFFSRAERHRLLAARGPHAPAPAQPTWGTVVQFAVTPQSDGRHDAASGRAIRDQRR
jgi:hypothetical protein